MRPTPPLERRPSTVALVGGDGSGKTSVARELERSPTLRCKYLYMGQSVLSGNVPLPTTRLARRIKLRESRRMTTGRTAGDGSEIATQDPHYQKRRRGWGRRTAGFVNRLAEAWWRQLLSMVYRARGYIVVYDRHFLLEAASEAATPSKRPHAIDRLEHWLLSRSYPPPDLVVFLDAPSEVLSSRRAETNPKRLDERRAAILRQGARMANFNVVDATRPLDEVVAAVTTLIHEFGPVTKQEHRGRSGTDLAQ